MSSTPHPEAPWPSSSVALLLYDVLQQPAQAAHHRRLAAAGGAAHGPAEQGARAGAYRPLPPPRAA